MGSTARCFCWSETATSRQQPLNFPGRRGPLCGMGRCFLRRRVRAAPAAIFLSLPWEMPWRRRSPLYQGEPVFSFEKSAHPGQKGSRQGLVSSGKGWSTRANASPSLLDGDIVHSGYAPLISCRRVHHISHSSPIYSKKSDGQDIAISTRELQ